MDPLLTPTIPSLPSLLVERSTADTPSLSYSPSSIVAEGMPPIPVKLIEKIRKWEYVDLVCLLEDHNTHPVSFTLNEAGQWVPEQQKRRKLITDIFTWIQAYSRYMAVLLSSDTTTREEATGLAAHLHLVLQLSQDLGSQWLKYDRDFREWAAAKSLRKWGDLNFPIYGQCLAAQQRQALPSVTPKTPRGQNQFDKRKSSPYSNSNVCLKWNFRSHCDRTPCPYAHRCFHCGRQHKGKDCKANATT